MPAVESEGLGLHPTQEIVNVQWGGGLAVEFGDRDQAPVPEEPSTD